MQMRSRRTFSVRQLSAREASMRSDLRGSTQFLAVVQGVCKWRDTRSWKMLRVALIVALCAASAFGQANNPVKKLQTLLAWNNLEMGFPSERDRQDAFFYGYYRTGNVLPLDVAVSYAGGDGSARFFVTIPRFGDGVPFSLAEVSNETRTNGPLLIPYPSYDWHNSQGSDCNGITSPYRIAIDECDRMLILDSGTVGFEQLCSPKIVVIDLNTNQEIDRYEIPSHLYTPGRSLLVTPVVDVEDPPPGRCLKTRIYIADSTASAIIVGNLEKRRFWRIENGFTGPDRRFATHTIAGESFQLGDGVFGLSLTPRGLNMERFLFFHALASDSEIAVPLRAVNNRKVWRGWDGGSDQFQLLGNRGTQCTQEAISSDGFQFCAYNNPLGIFAWDIRTPYIRSNRYLVAYNPETLQFVSSLKIVRNRNGEEEVLSLSNRLQKYYSKTMDYSEINFRVQSCRVRDLLSGASCRTNL